MTKLLEIFSFANIYRCYLACRRNKRNTINALRFEINAEENILKLERELKTKTYRPSRSILFASRKPKLREIFAADFRDRVVHHVLVDYLERIYEPIFIHDSYACRKDKGTHAAVSRLQSFLRKVFKNKNTRAYYLQLDIKDFFTSIDKDILFCLMKKKIAGKDILWLTEKILFHDPTGSFILRDGENIINKIPPNKSLFGKDNKKGLPIGNLTSQFFANVYMNELDQFVKHSLKARYYIRYVDDLVLLSDNKDTLVKWRQDIETFLAEKLLLRLHPNRRKLQPISNGIDFLGYITRRDYILVRRRVINNLKSRLSHFERLIKSEIASLPLTPLGLARNDVRSCLQSYLGHFKWANTYRLMKGLEKKKIISDYFQIRDYRLKVK
ncbi:MAG: reverse transcriptase/maturase family protein [Candidatus Omnitrophota bacterium]|nr:reverse transcriptase/maturase family protein [Candidatus Omnitrophota bacterium]